MDDLKAKIEILHTQAAMLFRAVDDLHSYAFSKVAPDETLLSALSSISCTIDLQVLGLQKIREGLEP